MPLIKYNAALGGFGTLRDGVPVVVALDDKETSIQSIAIHAYALREELGFDFNVIGFTRDYDALGFIREHGQSVFCVTTDHYRPDSFYEDRTVNDEIAIPGWAYPTSFGFFMMIVNEFCPEARWMRVTHSPMLVRIAMFKEWGRRDDRILGDHNKLEAQGITRDLLRAYLKWTLRRSRFGTSAELRMLAEAEAAITARWKSALGRDLESSSPCPALITSELRSCGFEPSQVLLRLSGHRVLALVHAPIFATGHAIVEITQPSWGLPPRLALVREFEGSDPRSGGWSWIATSCRSPYANTELRRGVYRVIRRSEDWAHAQALIHDVLSSRAALPSA